MGAHDPADMHARHPEQRVGSVLHVVATLGRGGTEVSCLALVREFARRGIANTVVALRRGDGAIEDALAQAADGPPRVLEGGRLARARAFGALVRARAPDAVIFHFFNAEHVTLGGAARLAGSRRIAAKQGNPAPADPAIRRKLRVILRATGALGIRLVSSSRWIEASMAELGALPAGASVVHNGADIDRIGTEADAARGAKRADEVRIGMVARLDPIKDHATLLEAVARLPEAVGGRPVRLVLVGDGTLRGTLEAEADRLGLTGRVAFLGARRDVPALLGGWDVFVLSTTRDEGFGVVLVEALAAGTPVVASDVPACREVLEAGALGRLVPPGDAAALAAALGDALATAPTPPDRAAVRRRYDVAAMADGYLAALGIGDTAPASRDRA